MLVKRILHKDLAGDAVLRVGNRQWLGILPSVHDEVLRLRLGDVGIAGVALPAAARTLGRAVRLLLVDEVDGFPKLYILAPEDSYLVHPAWTLLSASLSLTLSLFLSPFLSPFLSLPSFPLVPPPPQLEENLPLHPRKGRQRNTLLPEPGQGKLSHRKRRARGGFPINL